MTGFTTVQTLLRRGFWFRTMPLDATAQTPAVWVAIVGGASLGLVWGIAARLWMRLISTQPEFSLGGTAMILTITTLFGVATGCALAARRHTWPRWAQAMLRTLAVITFIPFGIAGGAPLMLTVLVATLAITQRAAVSAWILAVPALLVGTSGESGVVVFLVPTLALALTTWSAIAARWNSGTSLLVTTWLERSVRTVLLLLAAFGVWSVVSEIQVSKPGWRGAVAILCYLILLYPLVLALRVGLAPRASVGARDADHVQRAL
jgi:hypothetical protein